MINLRYAVLRLGAMLPRLTHTAISIVLMTVPLLLLPAWRAALSFREPGAELPSVWLLAGNLLMVSSVATASVLLLGRHFGAVATVVVCGAFVTAQQAWPAGPWATHFSTGHAWRTDWLLTATLLVAASLIVYATSAVPRDMS